MSCFEKEIPDALRICEMCCDRLACGGLCSRCAFLVAASEKCILESALRARTKEPVLVRTLGRIVAFVENTRLSCAWVAGLAAVTAILVSFLGGWLVGGGS